MVSYRAAEVCHALIEKQAPSSKFLQWQGGRGAGGQGLCLPPLTPSSVINVSLDDLDRQSDRDVRDIGAEI